MLVRWPARPPATGSEIKGSDEGVRVVKGPMAECSSPASMESMESSDSESVACVRQAAEQFVAGVISRMEPERPDAR